MTDLTKRIAEIERRLEAEPRSRTNRVWMGEDEKVLWKHAPADLRWVLDEWAQDRIKLEVSREQRRLHTRRAERAERLAEEKERRARKNWSRFQHQKQLLEDLCVHTIPGHVKRWREAEARIKELEGAIEARAQVIEAVEEDDFISSMDLVHRIRAILNAT